MIEQAGTSNHTKEEAIQAALEAAQSEVDQLRTMVAVLRGELERTRFMADGQTRDAVREHCADIEQLKSSVRALREELERKDISFEERIGEERRAHRGVVEELQQTIMVLREKLTGKSATGDGKR